MPPVLLIAQTGFDRVAQALLTPDGVDAAGLPTFDPTNALNVSPYVGGAILLPQTEYGMRITGAEACVSSGTDYPRGLRLAILSRQGDSQTLAGILATFPFKIGAFYPEAKPDADIRFGLAIPDLTQPNVENQFGLAVNPNVIPAQAGLSCHVDYWREGTTKLAAGNGTLVQNFGNSSVQLQWGEGRGALHIPPHTSAAFLFIALRGWSNAAFASTNIAQMISGAVHGYNLTAQDVGPDMFTTPARHNNVVVSP